MDIWVMHQMGGMIETQRTGVYPDYLIFSAPGLFDRRKVRVTEELPLKGSLKVKGKIVCNFIFNDEGCKIQEVNDGVANPEWVKIPVSIMMRD